MKFLIFILLFFNLNLIAAQENFYSTKDTTKLQIPRIDLKEEMRKTLFDCLRDGKMDDLIIYFQSDLAVCFIKDSTVLKTESVTNYKAIEILKSLERFSYSYFKIQYDLEYNGHDIILAKLFKSDLDVDSTINVYFFFVKKGSIMGITIQCSTK